MTSKGTELTLRLFDDLPELLKRVHTKPLFVMRVDVRQTCRSAQRHPFANKWGLLQRINIKARSRRQKRGNHGRWPKTSTNSQQDICTFWVYVAGRPSLTKGCRMIRFPFSALAIVLALSGVGAPSQAQESPATPESAASHAGSGAIRAACAEDRKTYCGDVEREHGLQCLNSHLASLSANCASAVQAAMARHQNSHQQQ